MLFCYTLKSYYSMFGFDSTFSNKKWNLKAAFVYSLTSLHCHGSATGPTGPRQDSDCDSISGPQRRGRAGWPAAARGPSHIRQRHQPGECQPGGCRAGPKGGQAGQGPDRSCQTAACKHQVVLIFVTKCVFIPV